MLTVTKNYVTMFLRNDSRKRMHNVPDDNAKNNLIVAELFS